MKVEQARINARTEILQLLNLNGKILQRFELKITKYKDWCEKNYSGFAHKTIRLQGDSPTIKRFRLHLR